MIKGYIPNCVFEASSTAPFPLQRFVCVPFPLPVLIDGVNSWIRSPVQLVYSVQTPGGLTTDQTDHKLDTGGDGEAGRQRESHLVVIVKPRSWAGTVERLGTSGGGVSHGEPRPPGSSTHLKHRFTTRNSWNWLRWSAVQAPSPCCLCLNHLCIAAARLIAQMRMYRRHDVSFPSSFMETKVLSWWCGSMCYYAFLN